MKIELEQKDKITFEKQQEKKTELILEDVIIPHSGHTLLNLWCRGCHRKSYTVTNT